MHTGRMPCKQQGRNEVKTRNTKDCQKTTRILGERPETDFPHCPHKEPTLSETWYSLSMHYLNFIWLDVYKEEGVWKADLKFEFISQLFISDEFTLCFEQLIVDLSIFQHQALCSAALSS